MKRLKCQAFSHSTWNKNKQKSYFNNTALNDASRTGRYEIVNEKKYIGSNGFNMGIRNLTFIKRIKDWLS